VARNILNCGNGIRAAKKLCWAAKVIGYGVVSRGSALAHVGGFAGFLLKFATGMVKAEN